MCRAVPFARNFSARSLRRVRRAGTDFSEYLLTLVFAPNLSMTPFSPRLIVALLVFCLAGACAPDAQNADPNTDKISKPDAEPSGKLDDSGDGNSEVEDTHGYPAQITSAGAAFGGVIAANGELDIALIADKDDTVVMWLRLDDGQDWQPSIEVYRPGHESPIVYHRPQNGEDAHIPYQEAQIEDGFEFRGADTYRLKLYNLSDIQGRYKFTLVCVAGPCESTDPIEDEEDAGDKNNDPDAGDGPYADLHDRALRDALRATHQNHRGLGYSGSRNARDFLFNYEMANEGPEGQIECIYTGRTAVVNSRRDAQNQQPMWNTEHTWPQSQGAGSEPAKSDLHHLFVADAEINGQRGSYKFGDVIHAQYSEGGSKLGTDAAGQTRFEVRDASKGNIARAVLYFAVAYDLAIDADEEATMRRWHAADAVDDAERARNDAFETAQNSRNFFIDWPGLVAQIDDF